MLHVMYFNEIFNEYSVCSILTCMQHTIVQSRNKSNFQAQPHFETRHLLVAEKDYFENKAIIVDNHFDETKQEDCKCLTPTEVP